MIGSCAAPRRRARRRLPAPLAPAASASDPLLPPRGKVFSGLSGGLSVDLFERQTGNHPAVFGFFTKFCGSNEFIFRSAEQADSRLMLHISTQDGYGTREVVTPRGIAQGKGDGYLVSLNRRIAEYGQPTYIRLMAEMNQANNGYSAFDTSGRSRGPAHSTAAFKQAWRRATLILRGGPVADIDAELRALRLPPVETNAEELPQPQVAMLWVPADPRDARHPGQHAARLLARRRLRRLGRDRLLQPLPELPLARGLLPRLPRQAVRVRRVGAVGRRRPRAS